MTPGLKRHKSRADTVSCLRKLADPAALLQHVYTHKLPLFMEESLQQQLQKQRRRRRGGLDLTPNRQPAIRTPLRGTLSGGDKV